MNCEELYREARKIAGQILAVMQREERDAPDLQRWARENEHAADVIENLSNEERLAAELSRFRQPGKEAAARRLLRRVRHRRQRSLAYRLAAGVAAGLLLVTWLVAPRETLEEASAPVAALVLPDGEKVLLAQPDDEQALSLAGVRSFDGEVIEYARAPGFHPKEARDNDRLCTLFSPRQAIYVVLLHDGTRVHLNGQSVLRYPERFSRDAREVSVEGEAYFEVAANEVPFIVRAREVSIRVHGTAFNVNTRDPRVVEAVLVEGKIGLVVDELEEVLLPGQRCVVEAATGRRVVESVPVERYTAWTRGYFRYDNEPLEALTNDLARWFDVAFEYTDEHLKTLRVSASISRELPLEEILAVTGNTTGVRFIETKKERRWTVSR
jgi:ferric-dicitrate binding protein FerR (iron transport regulator)